VQDFIFNIFKRSVLVPQQTVRLHYEDQPVNAVYVNSRRLLPESHETLKHKYHV